MTEAVESEALAILRKTVTDYVTETYDFRARFPFLEGAGCGYDPADWQRCAEMGWLAVGLSPASDGFDGDPDVVGIVMRGVGEGLMLEPIFTSAVLSARLLRLLDWDKEAGIADAIASGTAIVTLAILENGQAYPAGRFATSLRGNRLNGEKIAVLHGDSATHFLVAASDAGGQPAIVLIRSDAPGVNCVSYRTLDGRRAATITLDTEIFIRVGTGPSVGLALERAIDEGIVALCSEAGGAINKLNRMTCAYLAQRRQFGRPIGTNQVLRHRMVECFIREEEVHAVTAAAQRALRGNDPVERRRIVSGGMAVVAAAGRHIANEAVQMHGGIGMTHEHAVSHYFKRLRMIELLLGGRSYHLNRFASSPPL